VTILIDLIGFSEHGPSRPEKLLLRLARSGWFSCCLSAFIAFWDHLIDRDLEDVGGDYSGVPRIDYCEHWPIRGARIQSIICARAAGLTSMTIETDVGYSRFVSRMDWIRTRSRSFSGAQVRPGSPDSARAGDQPRPHLEQRLLVELRKAVALRRPRRPALHEDVALRPNLRVVVEKTGWDFVELEGAGHSQNLELYRAA